MPGECPGECQGKRRPNHARGPPQRKRGRGLPPVIPGRRPAASPESMNTGLWNMDSRLGLSGRPGMTAELQPDLQPILVLDDLPERVLVDDLVALKSVDVAALVIQFLAVG